jgi:16S rRNA (cytidine1402-2'-O)-methyltransferase
MNQPPPQGKLYLVPSVLHDDDIAFNSLSPSVKDAVKDCQVFFAENERTARRFLKKLWPQIIIDNYRWYTIHKAEDDVINDLKKYLADGKNAGIISEAGCPCIADPGQKLVAAAHTINAKVIPLTGPSSILLALMASGMNGQGFRFAGYLPIETSLRRKAVKDLENDSAKNNCTQVFIETPYRNNQLLGDIINVCNANTNLCIATDITSANEKIFTKKIKEWKKDLPQLHKHTVTFLLYAGI